MSTTMPACGIFTAARPGLGVIALSEALSTYRAAFFLSAGLNAVSYFSQRHGAIIRLARQLSASGDGDTEAEKVSRQVKSEQSVTR